MHVGIQVHVVDIVVLVECLQAELVLAPHLVLPLHEVHHQEREHTADDEHEISQKVAEHVTLAQPPAHAQVDGVYRQLVV